MKIITYCTFFLAFNCSAQLKDIGTVVNVKSIWQPNAGVKTFNSLNIKPGFIKQAFTVNQYSRTASNTVVKKFLLKDANSAFSNGLIETTPNNYVSIGQTYDTIGSQFHWRLTLIGIDQNYNMTWKKSYGNNNFNYIRHLFIPISLIKKGNFLYSALMVADSNSQLPAVFIKFNFNGDTVWQKKYYTAGDEFYITSVCPTVDNGFLMTGAVQTNTPGYNNHPIVATYLLKTDIDGNKLWEKRFYKANLDETQSGYRIVQDSASKRIIIVGVQDAGTQQYSCVQVLDSLGNLINQQGSGGIFGNALTDVIKLKDGNFIAVGGNTRNDVIIFGYPTSESMIVKFDVNGNYIFRFGYDTLTINNVFNRVLEDSKGNLLVGGTYSALFNQGLGINDVTRIVKVDKNGNLVWKKYFDNYTNNGNQDGLSDMILTSDGNIAFTNCLVNGIVPKPMNYSFYKTDTSYCDINGFACSNFASVKEFDSDVNILKIYPNPTSGSLFIFSNQNFDSGADVKVVNCLGQIVFETPYKNEINVYTLPPGCYILRIESKSDGLNYRIKLIKGD